MLDLEGRNIIVTRGNILPLTIGALNKNGSRYKFNIDDVLRFKITEAKKVDKVVFQKDFTVSEASTEMDVTLTANEMKIGPLSSKPIDYWYEVELNPDTVNTQTIIGYSKLDGPAILTILPEGGDKSD